MEYLDIEDAALHRRLMDLYLALDLFPEVGNTLAAIRRAGLKTAILSNGSPPMLDAAIEKSQIGGLIDAVLSVEEVGVFKPHPTVYRLPVERLGIEPRAILFVSANAWDVYAASASGMRVAWVNRSRQIRERLPGNPDWIVTSLAELPPILGK